MPPSDATSEGEYRQEALGNGRIRFLVTPAASPSAASHFPLLEGGIAAVAFGMLYRTGGRWPGIAAGAGAFVVCWFAGDWVRRLRRLRLDRRRSPGGTFVASPQGIELPTGATIPSERRYRLVLRNGLDAGGGAPRGPAQEAIRVSYMLCVEHGERSITLAGGMTHATAHGLLHDTLLVLRSPASVLPLP